MHYDKKQVHLYSHLPLVDYIYSGASILEYFPDCHSLDTSLVSQTQDHQMTLCSSARSLKHLTQSVRAI